MKACRTVSRVFLGIIEIYDRFKDSQVVRFTKEDIPLADFNFALGTSRIFRCIRIDVHKLSGLLWAIPSVILKDVQFVSFILEENEEIYDLAGMVTGIRHVLYSTPKISHLQLATELLAQSDLNDVFDCSAVQDNLKDLRSLDIVGRNNRCNGNNGHTFDSYEKQRTILENCDQLASTLYRLESLNFPKMKFCHPRQQSNIQTTILNLLGRNRETLQKLFVHLDCWEQKAIVIMKLPRLTILTATVNNTGQDNLTHFLANHHDSLEELDVTVQKEFGKNLFDVIKQRCPNLKKFHLKAKKFVEFVGGNEQLIDWSFLGSMTRLRDFQLSRPLCQTSNWKAYGNGRRVLECLPRNQLKRLGFRGIGGGRICGFWRLNSLENQPALELKLNLLGGFRNLRRLSFYRCPDAVDDDVMRFIVTEMTLLEELEVSHCSQLSHFGFKGTSEDGSDSIRNLKGKLKNIFATFFLLEIFLDEIVAHLCLHAVLNCRRSEGAEYSALPLGDSRRNPFVCPFPTPPTF